MAYLINFIVLDVLLGLAQGGGLGITSDNIISDSRKCPSNRMFAHFSAPACSCWDQHAVADRQSKWLSLHFILLIFPTYRGRSSLINS